MWHACTEILTGVEYLCSFVLLIWVLVGQRFKLSRETLMMIFLVTWAAPIFFICWACSDFKSANEQFFVLAKFMTRKLEEKDAAYRKLRQLKATQSGQ